MNTPFNFEDRTFRFAVEVRKLIKQLPFSIANQEDSRQLIRSSGSIGANFIEANENVSRADFLYRARVSKKEARESHFWLRLIDTGSDSVVDAELKRLIDQSLELIRILGAMIRKSSYQESSSR